MQQGAQNVISPQNPMQPKIQHQGVMKKLEDIDPNNNGMRGDSAHGMAMP